jgi:hypothetical protein
MSRAELQRLVRQLQVSSVEHLVSRDRQVAGRTVIEHLDRAGTTRGQSCPRG